MKKLLAVFLLVSTFAAAKSPRDIAIQQVAQAERDFAKMSVAEGVRSSFLANFAENAIGFTPQPTKTPDLFGPPPAEAKAPRKNTLDWYPVWTDASRSGDFAFSTGPSVTTDNATGRKIRFGNFASVWRKQTDGKWKVVLDIGTEHAEPPAFAKKPWSAGKPSGYKAKNIDFNAEAEALKDFERAISSKLLNVQFYEKLLSDESRLHRQGMFPLIGQRAIMEHFSKTREATRFNPLFAAVSASGDLAYTYGAYTAEPGDSKGYYAHFWKRRTDGQWVIVIDVTNPGPPTQ